MVAIAFLLYVATVYAIIPGSTTLIAAATPFVVAENIMLGNNGFLTYFHWPIASFF
jgi:hypothetical protein